MSNIANIRAVITAEDKASKTLAGFASRTENLGIKVAKSLALASKAAGAAAIATTAFGIKTAGDLEAARQGFITLLGSAKAADKTIAQIKKDAASTPFELKGLIEANQMLTAVTKDGAKSERILLNVGKALASMGKGQAELDRIIVNLQQIGAVGHASMLDIKQFAFAGIPIFKMLEQQTGKTGDALGNMISNGEVTFDLLTQTFQKFGEGTGEFAKAFENQAGTFNQLVSNMKDSFTIFASDFVVKTGIFDVAKEAVARLTGAISGNKDSLINGFVKFTEKAKEVLSQIRDYLQPKFVALWTTITEDVIPAVSNLVKAIGPTAGVALVGAIGLAADTLNVLFKILTPVINFIADNTWVIYGFAAAYVTLKAALAFSKVFALLTAGFNALSLKTIPTAIGKMGALRLAVTTPMVMAIGVGAAVAAIAFAKQKLDEFRRDVEDTMDKTNSAAESQSNAVRKIKDLALHGTPDQKARAKKLLATYNATGHFASGGFTGRGGTYEPAGVVHKGEYVVPKSQVDQNTGTPKMGNQIIVNISPNIGIYAGTPSERRKLSLTILEDLRDLANHKNTTVSELLGVNRMVPMQ